MVMTIEILLIAIATLAFLFLFIGIGNKNKKGRTRIPETSSESDPLSLGIYGNYIGHGTVGEIHDSVND